MKISKSQFYDKFKQLIIFSLSAWSENIFTLGSQYWEQNKARKGTPDYEVLWSAMNLMTSGKMWWPCVGRWFTRKSTRPTKLSMSYFRSKSSDLSTSRTSFVLLGSQQSQQCPWQRAGTPFWSIWPGRIRSCGRGEPYALAVCVNAGNARELTCPRCRKIFPEGMLICLACGLSLATMCMSDMRRACQVFRLEELAEKLGFELTLDMLGDDDVARTTQGSKQIRSAAAVLKNHARSYMKQARKAGMSLLQRLGTDAHYAFNCAVQDLTPKCMHWITVLGNVVLPNIKRTKEEIRTGKVRQYKARMCLVAYEAGQMQTLVVDDHVLFWYRNRFYRGNHFAAAYAILPVQDRFEVLSEANTTFQSLALSNQDVYADILSYVDSILRPLTEAKDTEGGSRTLPATKQTNPDYTRSTRLGYGSHQGPTHGYSQQEWNDFYNQWIPVDWPEDWRRRNQGHQYRDRRWSGYGYRWGIAERKLSPDVSSSSEAG